MLAPLLLALLLALLLLLLLARLVLLFGAHLFAASYPLVTHRNSYLKKGGETRETASRLHHHAFDAPKIESC